MSSTKLIEFNKTANKSEILYLHASIYRDRYQKVVSLISLREKGIKQKMKSKVLLIKKIYYLKYISYKATKGIELVMISQLPLSEYNYR